MAIAYYFTYSLGKPAKSEWAGKMVSLFQSVIILIFQRKNENKLEGLSKRLLNVFELKKNTKDLQTVYGGVGHSSSPVPKKMK